MTKKLSLDIRVHKTTALSKRWRGGGDLQRGRRPIFETSRCPWWSKGERTQCAMFEFSAICMRLTSHFHPILINSSSSIQFCTHVVKRWRSIPYCTAHFSTKSCVLILCFDNWCQPRKRTIVSARGTLWDQERRKGLKVFIVNIHHEWLSKKAEEGPEPASGNFSISRRRF